MRTVALFTVVCLLACFPAVYLDPGSTGLSQTPEKLAQIAIPQTVRKFPHNPRIPHASRTRSPRAAPMTLHWDRLAQCESSNNPRAVSPSGKYRGAFQFSLRSWHWIGMTGDPIAHSYAQQLAAAEQLYAQQGWRAWPVCGRYLR